MIVAKGRYAGELARPKPEFCYQSCFCEGGSAGQLSLTELFENTQKPARDCKQWDNCYCY